jgi:phage-related minor tail protein
VDAQWLTYAEYAERTGRTPHAARLRAARKHWRRQLGNDGRARILVPPEELEHPLEPPPEPRLERKPEQALEPRSSEVELFKRLGDLQAELAALAQRLAAAEGRAGAAEAQAEMERRRGDELRQDRDRALERLEQQIAELAIMRERMKRAEHDTHRAADALAAHLALPWWRRLLG